MNLGTLVVKICLQIEEQQCASFINDQNISQVGHIILQSKKKFLLLLTMLLFPFELISKNLNVMSN